MAILTELNLYPIKSCAGIALREATLTTAGLMSAHIYDREWMVVDAHGRFLTQRQHPKLALVVPRLKADTLELRAPGMLRLEIPLGLPAPATAPPLPVRVWDDTVPAYDCDETTAAWFSAFLGLPCRLARFHADARRAADAGWTGGLGSSDAPLLFADGFPLLVISQASLEDLNERLRAHGRAPLPMNRFRPNIVIGGVGPFEEDHAQLIGIGAARIKPVKPCVRCTMPSVDQGSGTFGADPLDILRGYRTDPKLGITFGMNAAVLAGDGQTLRVGQDVDWQLAF